MKHFLIIIKKFLHLRPEDDLLQLSGVFKIKALLIFKLLSACTLGVYIIFTFLSCISWMPRSHTFDYKRTYDVVIVIDVDEKLLYATSDGKVIKKYPVATGRPDSPTPLGDFQVVGKGKWGEGFGTSWMGLNVPWGNYGIHGTNNPNSIGYSVSSGCIRMRNRDVNELYKMVRIGTPVKIISGYYGLMGHGYKVIKSGDRGSDVQVVQKKLKEQGYYNGILDGVYGPGMERAIRKFEADKSLPITYDIGPQLFMNLGIILIE